MLYKEHNLLTSEDCGTQYAGETNLHRRGKTGCPYVTEHFSSCCKGKSYRIQLIEVPSSNGHDENGIVDENIRRLTHSMPVFPSYRNQLFDLLCKPIDWLLYKGNTGIQ